MIAAGLLLAISATAFAQIEEPEGRTILSSEAPELRFENLSIKDGMAQFSGQDIVQDSFGYMWIGTEGGLHRYNGYEFEIYATVPFDSTSLSSSNISSLEEASNGDIWAGTGNGLNRFNRETQTFTHFRHDPQDSTTIATDGVFDIYEAKNGDLWVSSGDGLSRLPAGETDRFIRYSHDPDDPNSLSTNITLRISEDAEGHIWVSSRQGVNRIKPETGQITRYLYEPETTQENLVRAQYNPQDDPGIVWLATGDGLVRLDAGTGEYTRFSTPDSDMQKQINLDFIDLTPDPDDPAVLWAVGFNTGVVRFDMRTEEYTFYRNNPGNPNSLVNNSARKITSDRSGKLWVGHFAEGVSQFTPSSSNFFHIRHDPQSSQSIGPDGVYGLYEDRNRTLWAGTGYSEDIYLNRIDLDTGDVTRYGHDPDDPTTITRLQVARIIEDPSGRFWIGTERGLNRFDRNTGKAIRYLKEPAEQYITDNAILSIMPSNLNEEELWVGTLAGLKRFDVQSGEFTDVSIQVDGAEDQLIGTSFYDSSNRVWANSNSGFVRLDMEGGNHELFTYNSADNTTISSNRITTIAQRENEPDILWLGTGDGGLNRFDINTGQATHFTTQDGLPDNVIYGILVDEQNTLWMSTNRGISNFNPDDNSFRNYGLEDGLIQLEFNGAAFAKGAGGILYFGHNDGITAFNPENLDINTTPPQVVISDIRLFNESVLPGPDSPLKEQIEKARKITIAHNQSEVAFEYVGLHYSNPSKNRYKYQLVGFDENWVDAGHRRTASYTNLAPGEYTFRVQASNSDGVWNEEGASLTLTVLPPWYRTWWAYGLFALLLAGFIFGGDRFQRRRLSIKEQERATLREAELRAEGENKRRADTEQLSKIGRTITSTLSVDKIINTTYQNVNELMDAEVFGVGIFNKIENRLEFPATKEKGKMLSPYSHYLDDDTWLSVWCFKNQEDIVISDFEEQYNNYIKEIVTPIQGDIPHSVIYLPLVHQGETIGVLTTQSFKKNAYSEYHVNLIRNLANYAAIALDNAEAYRKLNNTLTELKAAQTQLVQQEKLASLGQLTAGIAHEIKNPLNFVNNFSELSLELLEEVREEVLREKAKVKSEKEKSFRQPAEGKDGKAVQGDDAKLINDTDPTLILDILNDIETNLKKIHEHGSRADGIVKSMLQHSRGGSGKMESTDLNGLIKEYVNLAFHGMRAGKNPINTDIELDMDEKIKEIPLIAEDFSRVILNLCNNAFDAMREKLTADGERETGEPYTPKLTVRTKSEKGKIIIAIEDNGPGIPEEMKDKIMQPFFTTKKGTEGTGLGLSITNDIIKAHGGEFDIQSKEEGTIMAVTLYQS